MDFCKRFTELKRLIALCGLGLAVQATFVVEHSQSATIGVSIPLSGEAAELGQKFRLGVKLAMEQIGKAHDLYIVDDGCDPDLGKIGADNLFEAKPAIIIGMICNAPAKAIADRFSGSNVQAIVAGARSVRLIKDRHREEWNLWRLSPGDDYPVEIAAQSIKSRWEATPYAIVDDGTIYGRSFTDILRARMDELGLKPQFSDTFRAAQSTQAGLLRRLKRSGVTAAFIASTAVEDLYTIAKNSADFDIELNIITTEALAVLPFLQEAEKVPEGIQIIMASSPKNEALEETLAEREIETDRHIYNGYAAVQIAVAAMHNGADNTGESLLQTEFQTVLGTVRFFSDGTSTYNPYALHRWTGKELTEQSAETQAQ